MRTKGMVLKSRLSLSEESKTLLLPLRFQFPAQDPRSAAAEAPLPLHPRPHQDLINYLCTLLFEGEVGWFVEDVEEHFWGGLSTQWVRGGIQGVSGVVYATSFWRI